MANPDPVTDPDQTDARPGLVADTAPDRVRAHPDQLAGVKPAVSPGGPRADPGQVTGVGPVASANPEAGRVPVAGPDTGASLDTAVGPVPPGARVSLTADCASCFGLCCVAPAFTASADFALTKPAGRPCPNLDQDFGCSIHDQLRPRGFPGCAVYDCFGAGQQVSQVTFGGQDWRHAPDRGQAMFDAFARLRQLHELLWYLTEAMTLRAARPVLDELRSAYAQIEEQARGSATALAALDLPALHRETGALLARASKLARAGSDLTGADLTGADLTGAEVTAADLTAAELGGAELGGAELGGADLAGRDLRGRDLRRASLRGACLIGADLCGADLTAADFAGADLRVARLSGADLSGSIFVTQAQLDAAAGDGSIRLPPGRRRPPHWRPA